MTIFDQFALDHFSESELSNIEVVARYLTTPAGKTAYKKAYADNLKVEKDWNDYGDDRDMSEIKADARNGALQDISSQLGIDPCTACGDLWPYTPNTFNSTVARSKKPEIFAKVLTTSS